MLMAETAADCLAKFGFDTQPNEESSNDKANNNSKSPMTATDAAGSFGVASPINAGNSESANSTLTVPFGFHRRYLHV